MIRYSPHPIPMFLFLILIIISGFTLSIEIRFILSIILLLLFAFHIQGKKILLTIFKIVIPLCIAIGLFMTLIYPETEQWFTIGGIRLSSDGLAAAGEMTSRILLLFTGIISFFNLITIQRLGSYLYQNNLPVWLVFILINGLKFVDRFRYKLNEILFYQRLRGMPLENIWQRWRATVKILIPLLYFMIEESSNRAIALEMRGFTATTRRTTLKPDKQTIVDKIFSMLILSSIIVILIQSIFL
jgi:energy-coupling factor transporter transmembrane protein EcfT